jgi:hypothetical protein
MSACQDLRTALRASHPLQGSVEAHLFVCRRCRTRARADRLYRSLPLWFGGRPAQQQPRDLDGFVAGVMRRVRGGRTEDVSRRRRRLAIGALLLFLATGAGGFLTRPAASADSSETASATAIGTLTGDVADSFWDGVLGWGA